MFFHNEVCQEKLKALVTRSYLWKEQGGLLVMSHAESVTSRQQAERLWAAPLALVRPLWGYFSANFTFRLQ